MGLLTSAWNNLRLSIIAFGNPQFLPVTELQLVTVGLVG
jgi:hypothetical protein